MANKYYIINAGHRQVKDIAKEYTLAELKEEFKPDRQQPDRYDMWQKISCVDDLKNYLEYTYGGISPYVIKKADPDKDTEFKDLHKVLEEHYSDLIRHIGYRRLEELPKAVKDTLKMTDVLESKIDQLQLISDELNKSQYSYKLCNKEHIGSSDRAVLTLAGLDSNNQEFLYELAFGEDNTYDAYIAYENTDIGEHYKKVVEFFSYMEISDDDGFVTEYKADKICVYRAGEMGCVIQLINKK